MCADPPRRAARGGARRLAGRITTLVHECTSSARPRERPSWRLRRLVLAAVGSHRPTEPTARRPERSVEPSAVHEAGCERECQPTLSCDTRSLRRFSRAETALLDRADRARHRQQGARDDKSDKAACQAERL